MRFVILFLILVSGVLAQESVVMNLTASEVEVGGSAAIMVENNATPIGIEHEDIGPVDAEVDDEVLVAMEHGGSNGMNEIVMDDTKGSEAMNKENMNGSMDDSTIGIEHEDIGPASGDPDRPVIVGKSGEEIDDDTAMKGKKITENTAMAKPKEIVVVGSKVRTDDKHKDWIALESMTVDDEDDLEEYITGVVNEDRNVEEVAIYFNKIEYKYNQPAQLFGFIPLRYTLTAEADDLGMVKVKAPWWVRFTKNNIKTVGDELEKQVSTVDLDDTVQTRYQVIKKMSNVFRQYKESDMEFT